MLRRPDAPGDAAVWAGGADGARVDVWFLPALAGSHQCYREAFAAPLAKAARMFVFDPPGVGESPSPPKGLTVRSYATLVSKLIAHFSPGRAIVLVAHSMAAIAATEAAPALGRRVKALVSVEGNLTRADAFLTGLAARHRNPSEFHRVLCAKILQGVERGAVPMRYYTGLRLADPRTLWTLSRSVVRYSRPGLRFAVLQFPTIYYWDAGSVPEQSARFLASSRLRQRRLDGCGHWPMVSCPERFYAFLEQDVTLAAR